MEIIANGSDVRANGAEAGRIASMGSIEPHGVYQRIREGVAGARAMATLQPGVELMLSEGLSREEYLDFLTELYHIVWHFCPIMAAAAARCGNGLGELRYALYNDIHEEKGHEQWVLEDIEAIGGTRKDAIASRPSVPVRAMIGHNYYVAERGNPWAVLGMVHVLEEISANYGSRVAQVTAKRLNIEGGCGVKFLGSHGALDQDHVASFKDLLEHVDSADDEQAIIEAAEVNYAMFGALFRGT